MHNRNWERAPVFYPRNVGTRAPTSIPPPYDSGWPGYFSLNHLDGSELGCAGLSRALGGPLEALPVLLVEDEALISSMVEDALGEAGFAVTVVARGDEALRLLEDPAGGYRALITDVNLADDLSGWKLARLAREITPDLPIVYTSGGGASEWTANGVPKSILIAKPFAVAQIVTAVSQLINETAPGEP